MKQKQKQKSQFYTGKCGNDLRNEKSKLSGFYANQAYFTYELIAIAHKIYTMVPEAERTELKELRDRVGMMGAYTTTNADGVATSDGDIFGATNSERHLRFLQMVSSYLLMYLTETKSSFFLAHEQDVAAFFGLDGVIYQKKYEETDLYKLGDAVLQVLPQLEREALDKLHGDSVLQILDYLNAHRKVTTYMRSLQSMEEVITAEGIKPNIEAHLNELYAAEQEVAYMQADVLARIFASMCPSQVNYLTLKVMKPPAEDTCPGSCPSSCVWKRYTVREGTGGGGGGGIIGDEDNFVETSSGTCKNKCEKKAESNDCWCDSSCSTSNDW